jgi:hypothetical protein
MFLSAPPEIDVWFIFFDDHDKPLLRRYLEILHPHDTVMHLMRKIRAGDYMPTADATIGNMEVWKFRSLTLDPRDDKMDELLSNLKFTDNENSDVELVKEQKMMEELRLKKFEPLLVRVQQKSMQRLFLRIMFPTELSYVLNS